MPSCGSQFWLCDLPIRFDTYVGCTHDCKYCFVQKKKATLTDIAFGESPEVLASFISGKKTRENMWCDWKIPLHFGGMSDPFQPAERKYKRTLEALRLLSTSQYPVVISTKGRLCIEGEWLEELKKCNVVMQISMVCDKYDVLEKGAPTFRERLEMVRVLSKSVKRVLCRMQPYIIEVCSDVLKVLPEIKEAGAHGVILEGMKFAKKKSGLVKCGGDFCYPVDVLKRDFTQIKAKCRQLGLAFYSGENRLRNMGDSLTCCGVADLEGFKPNTYNLNHIFNGDEVKPTAQMQKAGTGLAAINSCMQSAGTSTNVGRISFAEAMKMMSCKDFTKKALGLMKE